MTRCPECQAPTVVQCTGHWRLCTTCNFSWLADPTRHDLTFVDPNWAERAVVDAAVAETNAEALAADTSRRALEARPGSYVIGEQAVAHSALGVARQTRHDTVIRSARSVGWTECDHDDWRAGHVLDPFGGSGTTAAVATGLGRDCTLIDLDERNLELARARIGMFLTDDEVPA